MKNRYAKISGFTIIELSVVVVVIGILASIVAVNVGGYINRSLESKAKSSLIIAAEEMKRIYDREGEYPSSLPQNIQPLSGVTLTPSGGGEVFCITATASGSSFFVNQSNLTPQPGNCAGGSGPPDPTPVPPGPG